MKRYIARVKIYKKPIFSLICSGEKDYIVSFPKSSDTLNNGGFFNFHFTVHTANNRATHKITNFGNVEKGFNEILNEASSGNDFYVSKDKNGNLKDIDMTKGETYLDLDNPRFIGNIFKFGINDIHNEKGRITNFFSESKKPDNIFKKIIDIEFPEYLKDIEIHLNVCKNFICNPFVAYKQMGVKYESGYLFQDRLNGDCYTFVILIKEQKK